MSREERTGRRDLTYSAWHRDAFPNNGSTNDGTMIDLDDVEYCCRCRMVLAVIEVARTSARSTPYLKPALVTMDLARRLNVPGFVLQYRTSAPCTCEAQLAADCPGHDIEAFYVERLWPSRRDGRGDSLGWLAPAEVRTMLSEIRQAHMTTACPFGRPNGK